MAGRAAWQEQDERTEAPRSGRRRSSSIVTFGLLLLLCVGVGSAFANESSTQTPGLPTSGEVIEAIETDGPQSVQSPPTDPTAAAGLPHRDLDRSEALELLQGVFEAQLQSPLGIFDDLEVEKLLSQNVAVVVADEPLDVGGKRREMKAKLPQGTMTPTH